MAQAHNQRPTCTLHMVRFPLRNGTRMPLLHNVHAMKPPGVQPCVESRPGGCNALSNQPIAAGRQGRTPLLA